MLSESARATQAGESKYRIQSANSRRRRIRVLLLGDNAAVAYADLIGQNWLELEFLRLCPDGEDFRLTTLSGQRLMREDFIATADEIVLMIPDCRHEVTAQRFGRFCNGQGRLITVVVNSAGGLDQDCNRLLGAVRPHAGMVILSDELEYAEAMLAAFHARACD